MGMTQTVGTHPTFPESKTRKNILCVCTDSCVMRTGVGGDMEKLGLVVQWKRLQAGPGKEAGTQDQRAARAGPSLGSGDIFCLVLFATDFYYVA